MKLGVLGIVSLLFLTGCSSSPSIETQTKLVEYEKCLDNEISKSRLLTRSAEADYSVLGDKYTNYFYDMKNDYVAQIENCKSYRP